MSFAYTISLYIFAIYPHNLDNMLYDDHQRIYLSYNDEGSRAICATILQRATSKLTIDDDDGTNWRILNFTVDIAAGRALI